MRTLLAATFFYVFHLGTDDTVPGFEVNDGDGVATYRRTES